MDGVWLSGSFDRVVVERDKTGRAVAATVYDFKTDRLDREARVLERAERYRAQLERYRAVVQRLTGIPVAEVQGVVVFLVPGALVPVV